MYQDKTFTHKTLMTGPVYCVWQSGTTDNPLEQYGTNNNSPQKSTPQQTHNCTRRPRHAPSFPLSNPATFLYSPCLS